jgi:sigma-54 dependent transcriptional regulator, acetoin dehydrogenase operon transcriptional activator AcoR
MPVDRMSLWRSHRACRSLAKRKLTQMEALERDAIIRSLEDHANNKLQAAIALGTSRATIYRKMRDYGIA